jgi:hypothetical protein
MPTRDFVQVSCQATNTWFSELLLMLSGDVESNPGPPSLEDVMNLLREMKADVSDIKKMQNEMKSDMGKIRMDINNMKARQEEMQLDIDSINDDTHRLLVRLEKSEAEVERLERHSRSRNMIIKGNGIAAGNENENVRDLVMERVLKVAFPDKEWKERDIPSCHRLWQRTKPQGEGDPTPIIVKFASKDDKMSIMINKKKLQDNIRVTDDLTRKQREIIKREYDNGKIAFYRNQKLIVKEKPRDRARANYRRKNGERQTAEPMDQIPPREASP